MSLLPQQGDAAMTSPSINQLQHIPPPEQSIQGRARTSPAAFLDAAGAAGPLVSASRGMLAILNLDVTAAEDGTPQGKARVTINSDRDSAGEVDGKPHTYVIGTNRVTSLKVRGSVADVTAIAVVTELLMDSNGSVASVVTLDREAPITIALDMTHQTIALTVRRSDVAGDLWYASRLVDGESQPKQVSNAGAGPIQVHAGAAG
jgi:hypothetical protein